MNIFIKTAIILTFIGISNLTIGQTHNITSTKGVDPRQFVTIKEINRQTNEHLSLYRNDTIRLLKVDANSLVKVEFDQSAMAENFDYYGNVSVIAKINDEAIKVSPYSKVGEKQGKIGVKSESLNEISSHILSLYDQIQTFKGYLDNFWFDQYYDENNKSKIITTDYDYCLAYFDSQNKNDTVVYKSLSPDIQNLISNYSEYNAYLLLFVNGESTVTNEYIVNQLTTLKTNDTNFQRSLQMAESKSQIQEYKDLLSRLDLVKSYLNYFQHGDPELKELYLKLLKHDELSLDDFIIKLSYSSEKLHVLDSLHIKDFSSIKFILDESLRYITPSFNTYTVKLDQAFVTMNLIDYSITDSSNIYANKKIKEEELVKRVGELLYQKLFDGNIDLREARASEGDLLKVSLLWYENEDSSLPKELELASYQIKDVGWRLKVSDSFFLIDRISDPDDTENLSPSKFKGAPGASLLFSYGNNGHKNNLLKRLEPSLGINISYVDFYTNKDLEVGVGAVLGILRNNILLTIGYNLHAESNGGYMGLGFSFANISSQIKKNNK